MKAVDWDGLLIHPAAGFLEQIAQITGLVVSRKCG
jgi:hypothetical protein